MARRPKSKGSRILRGFDGLDVFFYNGLIQREHDLAFMNCIADGKSCDKALLILVTDGGDPDAGYKISRYFQEQYASHIVLAPGLCKSAGTLIAMGANEVAMAPYGELGPVDIQSVKTDNLAERQSGLVITEAIETLISKAISQHGRMFSMIMNDTAAIVSFNTATHAATELVTGLFAPIFRQIDPYDVGDKARAMRIASDYGQRLAARTQNLKPNALEALTQTYPSHSFVIDLAEARLLFTSVREWNDAEKALCLDLGELGRHQDRMAPKFACLTLPVESKEEQDVGDKEVSSEVQRPADFRGDSTEAAGAANPSRQKVRDRASPARKRNGSGDTKTEELA